MTGRCVMPAMDYLGIAWLQKARLALHERRRLTAVNEVCTDMLQGPAAV